MKANAIHAAELDPGDHLARRTAAFGYYFDHQLERFRSEAKAAIELGPNDATVLAELGFLTAVSGDWEAGIALVGKANALNPDSAAGWYHAALFYDLFRRAKYREALEIIRLHPDQNNVENQQKYVSAYAELGDLQSARQYWEKCRELEPAITVDKLRELFVLWNFDARFVEHYFRSFAKAGVS